jgi:hypothetical protein
MKRYGLLSVLVIASVLVGWLLKHRDTLAGDPLAPAHRSAEETQRGGPQMNTAAPPTGSDVISYTQAEPTLQRDAQYFLTLRDAPTFRGGQKVPLPDLPPPDEKKLYPGELEARTPEEAVWLDQHGYPTQEELEALDRTSALDLAQRAAEGDLAALALLGEKQLREKATVGLNNLDEAALQGSVWAILALGDFSRQRGDFSTAFAYYNLAAMRGDWISPSLHMTLMPDQLDQHFFLRVPQDTAYLLATLQYLRQQRGLPPLANTPRPNIFNRPDGLKPIGVYRRRRGG